MLFLSPLFEAGASLSYQHKWVGTFKHFSSHFSSFCLLTSPSIGSVFWRRVAAKSRRLWGRCYNHFSKPVGLVYRDPPLCISSTLDYPTTMLERRHTGNRNISEALWCIFKSFIMTGNMFFQWGKVHIIVRRGIHDHMKTWIASRCLAWPLNHRSTLHKRTPSFWSYRDR